MARWQSTMTWIVAVGYWGMATSAQETFDLIAPGAGARSTAALSPTMLIITDGAGQTFRYRRAPEHDAVGDRMVGYANEEIGRVIRWPANGQGAMQIGEVSRGRVTYRASQMQIQPRGGAAAPILGAAGLIVAQPIAAVLEDGQAIWAAQVRDDGKLLFATLERDQWRVLPAPLVTPLLTNAPIVLLRATRSRLPTVVQVDAAGRLVSVEGGERVVVRTASVFVPGTHLSTRPGGTSVWAVDRSGTIVQVDSVHWTVEAIDASRARFAPGGPVLIVGDDLFLADLSGELHRYRRRTAWESSALRDRAGRSLGSGITRTTRIAGTMAIPLGDSVLTPHVAFVDDRGRPQVLFTNATGDFWHRHELTDVLLAPGAPLAFCSFGERLFFFAVLDDGRWHVWRANHVADRWTEDVIARGMAPFCPPWFHSRSPYGFAVDARGMLVVAHYRTTDWMTGDWNCHVCSPRFAFAPRLVSRELVANPVLEPARVEFVNRHRDELWVLLADLRDSRRERRLKIPAGKSTTVELDRDAGSQLVETVAVLGPLGQLELQEQVFDIPPRPIYDASVYELFLQSIAIDSTKRGGGKIEDENWSPRSLGFFPIPAGGALRSDTVIDVYEEARRQKNPGGVRRLDIPAWKAMK